MPPASMLKVPYVPTTPVWAMKVSSGLSGSEAVRVPLVVRAASVSVRVTAAAETVAASLVPLMVIATVLGVPSALLAGVSTDLFGQLLTAAELSEEAAVRQQLGILGFTVLPPAEPSTRSRSARARGAARVVAVDITEFEKLEGCVTCLSVRLRG